MTRPRKADHEPALARARFPMRLNQYLAKCGVCARRKAETHIQAGDVHVNGQVTKALSTQVQPEDTVVFKGHHLQLQPYTYLLLNKPKDYLSTRHDPKGRRTVFSLLPLSAQMLSYVGRLDRNSTGLLLFTNDGILSEQLSHPSYHVEKVYQIVLNKALAAQDRAQLSQKKILLSDGPLVIDRVQYHPQNPTHLEVSIHSGRNRILRRLFTALGYEVRSLDRIQYGPLSKKHLAQGCYRLLTDSELRILFTSLSL